MYMHVICNCSALRFVDASAHALLARAMSANALSKELAVERKFADFFWKEGGKNHKITYVHSPSKSMVLQRQKS